MKHKILKKVTALRVPIETGSGTAVLSIAEENRPPRTVSLELAKERLDFWAVIHLSETPLEEVRIEVEDDCMLQAVEACSGRMSPLQYSLEDDPAGFHLMKSSGLLGPAQSLVRNGDEWVLICVVFPAGEKGGFQELLTLKSRDMIYWKENGYAPFSQSFRKGTGKLPPSSFFLGVNQVLSTRIGEDTVSIGWSKALSALTIPFWEGPGGLHPAPALKRLRVWKREWRGEPVGEQFREELRWRIAPGNWPNIRILAPDYTCDDIQSERFEVQLTVDVGQESYLELKLLGLSLKWNAQFSILTVGAFHIPLPTDHGKIVLTLWKDTGCCELLAHGRVIFLSDQEETADWEQVENNLTRNMQGRVETLRRQFICLRGDKGTAVIEQLTVFGLRAAKWKEDSLELLGALPEDPGPALYRTEHYAVYRDRVEDSLYGEPPAYAVDSCTVASPVRVTEEFRWRNTPWGDMSRVVDRGELWRESPNPSYPSIRAGIPSFDAACAIAFNIFDKCSGEEYALNGQKGLWSGGCFQCKGEGFGVWLRDSAHIALRGGDLFDPACARRTLLYILKNGFDNGADGPAMLVVGLWDYYLASNDISTLFEAWPGLLEAAGKIDGRYDEAAGLVSAGQSTSNDSLPEPECGGYSLSGEIYYMQAYRALARIACLTGLPGGDPDKWERRAQNMKAALKERYWCDKAGYYASGPTGSEAYQNAYWETSGQEAALWDKFGLADTERRRRILKALPEAALGEFGVTLFPYRTEENHFCRAAWVVWSAGIAAAAAQEGDSSLIFTLIAQQVRNCLLNKTFHEVIDVNTGLSWRWPGQLWHASGFLACFVYGVFGISYDEEGMHFSPAVDERLAGIMIRGLHYGKAVLDIHAQGSGTGLRPYLDGKACDTLPRTLKGRHLITLK